MKHLLSITLVLAALPAAALELKAQARAIPDMCEFVYRVESDYRFVLEGLDERGPPASLEIDYDFDPAYADTLPADASGILAAGAAAPTVVESTFVTMSTNPRYLYQGLYLRARVTWADGTASALPDDTIHGEGARYFLDTTAVRDRCYRGGRAATPYRDMMLEPRVR